MFDRDDRHYSTSKNVAQSPADPFQDPTTVDALLTEYLGLTHSGANKSSQRGLIDMHGDGIHGPQEISLFMLKKRENPATTLNRVFHCSSKVPSKRARTCDGADDDSLSNTIIENKRKREMNTSTDTWTRTARPAPRALSVYGVQGLIAIPPLCTGKIRVPFLSHAQSNPVNFVKDYSTLAMVLPYSSRSTDLQRLGFDHFGQGLSVSRLKLDYGQSWQVEEFRLEDEAVKLSRQVGDRNKAGKSVERKLHTSILCNYGNISNLGVTEDFIDAIGQIMTCLHIIDKKQIRHRDVSVTNIVYYRTGDEIVAVLIDFDSATYPPPNVSLTSDYHTGTAPFMAFELLGDSKHEYSLRHDLESCIHCIFWNGAGYLDVKKLSGKVQGKYLSDAATSSFRNWQVGSWEDMATAKVAFYVSTRSSKYIDLLRDVNVKYSDLCERFVNLLGAEYVQCKRRAKGSEDEDKDDYMSVPKGFRLTYTRCMKALRREEFCNEACCQ